MQPGFHQPWRLPAIHPNHPSHPTTHPSNPRNPTTPARISYPVSKHVHEKQRAKLKRILNSKKLVTTMLSFPKKMFQKVNTPAPPSNPSRKARCAPAPPTAIKNRRGSFFSMRCSRASRSPRSRFGGPRLSGFARKTWLLVGVRNLSGVCPSCFATGLPVF